MLLEASYPIAPRGRATSFTESELPPEFALQMLNRFINAAGGAEKRQGIVQLGSDIDGAPNLNGLHELVQADGTAILFVSGQGTIWKFDTTFTQVHSGLDQSSPLQSVQMGDRLIFFNGIDRNFFTKDGGTFTELKAIIERGASTSGTDEDSLHDSDVENWVTDTNVVENDIVFNLAQNGFGVVTAVATASVSHTDISPTATGIGIATATAQSGDRYEIIDAVELNVIPTDGEDDNTATTGSGTSTTEIVVSAVADWTKTDVRIGDFIRNTTRTAITQVTAIATANIGVHGITGQTSGDSIILLKSAMPIATRGHVHFGRLYMIDARDQRRIRISGPDNPEDLTTQAGTLDSTTFKFGELQPEGDAALSMASFQRFFCIAGRKNLYLFQGTDPVADTSAATTDFDIIGLFPQGIVSKNGMLSIGNDLVFVTPDGVQSSALVGDASSLGRANLSEAIKTTLREDLLDATENEISVLHYPKRSWFLLKVGSQIHVYNYTAYFGQDELSGRAQGTVVPQRGSWSLFDGKFARQNAYLVRLDRSMVCCGPGGKVYTFDNDNVFDDDGETYSTEYQTGWLTGDEPKKSVRTKQGIYIKPIVDAGDNIDYTIRAESGFDLESEDTITITASGGATPIGLAKIGSTKIGGSSVQNIKHPLRWRGEQVRLTFTTNDQKGPDTVSRYTLYANRYGKR